jgi:ABC-type multidrug transport system fused ATPase/permease subunit
LCGISLDAEAGQKVALVGRSGAGKTTLMNLLLRFHNPGGGKVYVDDVDIADLHIRDVRRLIGIVPQDVFLFSGTVRQNIAYGKHRATEQEIIAAAKLANAHEFIVALPRAYETEIGERGIKLSGGERQRLAIARTILRDPKILIMDEATSEVDSESERLIRDALSRLLLNRTAFIIAHRLSTVLDAEKIVVLDGGGIVSSGNHRELYANCELYRRLCDLQFNV